MPLRAAVSLWDGWARQVGSGHVCVKLVPRSLPARAITSCTGRLPAARTRAPRGPAGPPGPVILDPARDSLRGASETGSRAVRYRKTHTRTQRAAVRRRRGSQIRVTGTVRRVDVDSAQGERREQIGRNSQSGIYETSRGQRRVLIYR